MANITPRLCVSHTIAGSCVMRVAKANGTQYSITIPPGRYWTDPVYGAALAIAGSPCLLGEIAYLMTQAMSGVPLTWTKSYVVEDSGALWTGRFDTSENGQFHMENAACTAAGRDVAARLGIDPASAFPASAADPINTMRVHGIWSPDYGATGGIDEQQAGDHGSVVVADDGSAYSLYVADPERRRLLRMNSVSSDRAVMRTRFPDSSLTAVTKRDKSFESMIYRWARRGEQIRYYSDNTTIMTYLTVACAATDGTITVAAINYFAPGVVICIDGEMVELVSSAGGLTWNVWRTEPKAHAIYAPIVVPLISGSVNSHPFMATYVLDEQGGNVNLQQFAPERLGYNEDYFNFEIPLVRANP